MERSPHYMRLFIATAGAVNSVAFVTFYSMLMAPIVQARVHFRFEQLPMLTQCVFHYSWFALIVPLSLLIVGVRFLREKKVGVGFETVVGCQWLFAFLWLTICLLVWLLPEVPFADVIH
jgi:hypothetical protein